MKLGKDLKQYTLDFRKYSEEDKKELIEYMRDNGHEFSKIEIENLTFLQWDGFSKKWSSSSTSMFQDVVPAMSTILMTLDLGVPHEFFEENIITPMFVEDEEGTVFEVICSGGFDAGKFWLFKEYGIPETCCHCRDDVFQRKFKEIDIKELQEEDEVAPFSAYGFTRVEDENIEEFLDIEMPKPPDIRNLSISLKDSTEAQRLKVRDILIDMGENIFERTSLINNEYNYSYFTYDMHDNIWQLAEKVKKGKEEISIQDFILFFGETPQEPNLDTGEDILRRIVKEEIRTQVTDILRKFYDLPNS